MANTLNLQPDGAVGFIDWLGRISMMFREVCLRSFVRSKHRLLTGRTIIRRTRNGKLFCPTQ